MSQPEEPPGGAQPEGPQGEARPEDDPRWVDAAPEKRFFISMLIRDIELIPAIVDLVDNSVDGARRLRPDGDFEGLNVTIAANPERFEIVDNCGGIEAETARHYAFRFGRPEEFRPIEGSLGQFGVGMKRALFKLGDMFLIESKAATSSFSLLVDVEEWAAERSHDWSFEFHEVDDDYRPSSPAELGTSITVERLHPSVSEDFALSQTLAKLRADLRLRHQEALLSGLKIRIEEEYLTAHRPMVLSSADIQPVHRRLDVGEDGSRVQLDLIAGLVGPTDDEDRDEGDAEAFKTPGEAGWYLFCNNRLLLSADRTALTGWGSASAAYHPQYRHFRGYAYLWADDSSLLPWNTTKTGVDQDSRVFRRVQQEMWSALESVISVMNRLKTERQQHAPENRPVTLALKRAEQTPVKDVPLSASMRVPPPPRVARAADQRITYTVDRGDFERVKEALDAPSAPEVGRRTFYFYRDAEVVD